MILDPFAGPGLDNYRNERCLLGPAFIERRGRLAGEQGGQGRSRADRGADIDRRTRFAVGDLALAIFEERLVPGVRPQDLITLGAAGAGVGDGAGTDDLQRLDWLRRCH
jgi:hypothetical protein